MTETPAGSPPFDLLAILSRYKSGEADWPTTKEALLTFPYQSRPAPPPMSDEDAYADWYNSDPETLPNSYAELTSAAHLGKLDWDRFIEVNDALMAPKK